jgi:poly(3-hydroxybutyrate) depolymerase
MRSKPGHGAKLSFYEFGATTLFAARADQRVSYCLYVPESYEEDGRQAYPLVVLVHGTERGAQRYRDEFIAFAESAQCIVLAPLFPAGIEVPGDLENYKFIEFRGMRFDLLLLDMVAEVQEKYRVRGERFLIHGFSGGGHFVHRFLYLHPKRVLAASIGAPGMVTLLDAAKPWHVGTADLEAKFGIAPDIAAMRAVRVQMIVGAEDTATWEITVPETSHLYMQGVNDAGRNRIERLTALKESFLANGIDVQLDIVPGVAHEGWKPALLDRVRDFFRATLAGGS